MATSQLQFLLSEAERSLEFCENRAGELRQQIVELKAVIAHTSPATPTTTEACCNAAPQPDSDGPVIETCEVHVDCRPAQQHIAKFARELQAALAPLANFDVPKP